jgi:hypothetical protein
MLKAVLPYREFCSHLHQEISIATQDTHSSIPRPARSDSCQVYLLSGLQKIAKFNESQLHQVNIIMVIFRLVKVDTEMLLKLTCCSLLKVSRSTTGVFLDK